MMANKNMTVSDRFRLTSQLTILEEVAENYHGQTIDNIIRQLQARLNEIIKQETI